MKFEIEPVENGFILRQQYKDAQLDGTEVDKIETLVYNTLDDVLHMLVSAMDPGSRHDKNRLYVIRAPGDKHEDFTENHAKVIWGWE